MPILFPPEIIENTVEVYHARITGKPQIILWYIAVIDGNYGSMPAYSKNLNNFGVQEMNAEEMRSTEGGWFFEFLRLTMKYEWCDFSSACPLYS